MANYNSIITDAQKIIDLANEAKAIKQIKESITPADGATVIPDGVDFEFQNDSSEMQTILTAKISFLSNSETQLINQINDLSDDIKKELV